MADYIDRQKAIDLIAEKQRSLCPPGRWGRSQVYGSDRDKYDSLEEAMDQLENIPAADVAPVVHGKWGWVNEDRYRCDRCEQITTVDECMGKPNYNFCPNCGARMVGVSDG